MPAGTHTYICANLTRIRSKDISCSLLEFGLGLGLHHIPVARTVNCNNNTSVARLPAAPSTALCHCCVLFLFSWKRNLLSAGAQMTVTAHVALISRVCRRPWKSASLAHQLLQPTQRRIMEKARVLRAAGEALQPKIEWKDRDHSPKCQIVLSPKTYFSEAGVRRTRLACGRSRET